MPTISKPPGQKRGNRHGPAPNLVTDVTIRPDLPPPAHLGEAGKDMWGHICRTADAWLSPSDLPTLLLVADGFDRRAMLAEDVRERGAVLELERTTKYDTYIVVQVNPALSALERLEAQITRWLTLLGLSPSDRAKLGIQKANAATTLQRLRQSRSGSPETPASSSPSMSHPSPTPPSSTETESGS